MSPADPQLCRWHAYADKPSLQQAAGKIILDCASQAMHQYGKFHLVLAGGNTPRGVYAELRLANTNWSAWHIYFGDERCLPAEDAERNSRMAGEAWLDHVPIPTAQLHVIPAELGANQAASTYAETLHTIGEFDLVLLGIGEDGHTASLFPGHDWGTAPQSPDVLAVFDAPKPPPERVSLSAARLSRARKLIFLVSGESKREAIDKWRTGKDIPARAMTPAAGLDVLVETALLEPLPD